MGYACPVCGDPQADAGHLANHLAFTAILGEEGHEAWLDERAPGWEDAGQAELAERIVAEEADVEGFAGVEEVEFPQVFEDTVGGLDESTPDDQLADPAAERSGALFDEGADRPVSRPSSIDVPTPSDAETEAVLEEAREMTREMLDGEPSAPSEKPEDTGDEAGDEASDEAGHPDGGGKTSHDGDETADSDEMADGDETTDRDETTDDDAGTDATDTS